ncbi:MAG: TlpA family protein disulfide reductase [Deltaproteobacteria bacterium]|nr:TlpA family protein disulfide reductase [Deltaproteobacteria bacterium]
MALILVPAAAGAQDQLVPGAEAPAFLLSPINPEQCGFSGVVSLNGLRQRDDATRPKVYLVTFFASWCEPCKKEIPELQALYTRLQAKGLMVIDISIDTDDQSYAALASLLSTHKVTFPVLWDKYAVMGKRYKVSRLPCVLLLDADARIVKIMIGYEEESLKRLIADIETMLAGGKVTPGIEAPVGKPVEKPHETKTDPAPAAAPQPPSRAVPQTAPPPPAPVAPYGSSGKK